MASSISCRERRKALGLCVYCGKEPLIEGKTLCISCRDKKTADSSKRYATAKLNNLCGYCNEQPSNGLRYCDKCRIDRLKRDALRRRERAERGLCVTCGKDKAEQRTLVCELCTLKQMAKFHLGSFKNHKQLWELWKAHEGKCAITGVPIALGGWASLDHIIPVSKGGTNDTCNLRFVHLWINRMKMDMMDDDFIPLLEDFLKSANLPRGI